MGLPDHLTCLLRNLYAGKKQQFELDLEQQTGSKLGKEWDKLYIVTLFIYLEQSTSCEMLICMKHKLESRLPGVI